MLTTCRANATFPSPARCKITLFLIHLPPPPPPCPQRAALRCAALRVSRQPLSPPMPPRSYQECAIRRFVSSLLRVAACVPSHELGGGALQGCTSPIGYLHISNLRVSQHVPSQLVCHDSLATSPGLDVNFLERLKGVHYVLRALPPVVVADVLLGHLLPGALRTPQRDALFRAWGTESTTLVSRFGDYTVGVKYQGLGFRVWDSGCRS
jgi:hypothetical protein